MKKAVAYLRVSTIRQAKEGESLATQKTDIEAYAARNEMDLQEIYADEGISGGSVDKRPGLQRLLRDAQNDKFHLVLIHRLSRLGRNARELLNNVELLKGTGVDVVFLKENIDLSTTYGKFMLTMLAAIAELERDIIGESSIENKIARAKLGIPANGKLPFGRKFNRKSGEWYFDPPEIRNIVENIADRYLGGEGLRDIADSIPKKYQLTYSNILKVFHNFCGDKWQVQYKKEDYPIVYEIPRLLSDELIDIIKDKIEFNRTYNRTDKKENTFLLSGYVRCMECNLALTAQTQKTKAKNKKSYIYKFYRHRGGSRESCKAISSIRTDKLENAVMKVIWENLSDEDSGFNDAWIDNYPNQEKLDSLIAVIKENKGKLLKAESERDKLIESYLNKIFPMEAIQKRSDFLTQEINNLKALLFCDEEKLKKLPTVEEVKEKERKLRLEFTDYFYSKDRFESMTFDEKRALLQSIFSGKDEDGKPLGIYVRRIGLHNSQPALYEYFVNARFFAGFIDIDLSDHNTDNDGNGSDSNHERGGGRDRGSSTKGNGGKKCYNSRHIDCNKTIRRSIHHREYGKRMQ